MAEAKQQKQGKPANIVDVQNKKREFISSLKSLSYAKIKRKTIDFLRKIHKLYWHKGMNFLHQYHALIQPKLHKAKKITLKVIRHWKFLTIFLPSFVFFYYLLGSMIAENIDVSTEYKVQPKHLPMFETAESMSFLLKREVDRKMWTPNLPFVFPASVLDNMPNFQVGIVTGVKDFIPAMRKITQNTDAQKKDLKTAYKLLNYPPNVWLMTRKGKFNLAPSSNSQYRKAAVELHNFPRDGVFFPNVQDLDILLRQISKNLQELSIRNETQQREKSANWIDMSSDDLFYFVKGYSFALWQITKTLGADFKEIILEKDLYTEWTYLVNSLKKAAEFAPRVIRNGAPNSLLVPNHLMVQSYYLQRAIAAAERIDNGILRQTDAN